MIGALEAGGTKMVCAIADESGKIVDRMEIPTQSPEVTMPIMIDYFKSYQVEALGVGCFGPIILEEESERFGEITTTPKASWRNYNCYRTLKEALHIPIAIDTDVNAAVLGEVCAGSCMGLHTCIYITIGTGVGVGVYANGRLLHGMQHPEGGHILLPMNKEDDFSGCCDAHRNCFEGLASGPAIRKRWGKPAEQLEQEDQVWELESSYIAQALVNYCLILAPQRIVLGGGVMHQKKLYPFVREKFRKYMNGYLETKATRELEHYIVAPALKEDQAIFGCFALAKKKLEEETDRVKKLTDNPFLNLYQINAETRAGNSFNYYFASRNKRDQLKYMTGKNRPEGVVIYALCEDDPGKIVLLKQFRYPLNRFLYELPAGLIDENETPSEAAIREMKEETGLDLTIYEGGLSLYRKPYYMAQGLTDESSCAVFGYVRGQIDLRQNESTEKITVIYADINQVTKLMEEDEMSMRCAYLMMQFRQSKKEQPFKFLD
ncbi:fructokinase [Lachnospiraceae bacterium KM106-2]|nr:fructokinase [Lachnospiraceae bacterium KM106-2]